jgi:hypothetical protein
MPSSISESIGAGTDAVAQAETDAFTLWWVSSGLATEANPFLEQIVTEHGFLFVVSKISIVILGTTLLWRYRTRPLAVLGIFAAFLVYYEVFLIHLSFASLLIGELIDA